MATILVVDDEFGITDALEDLLGEEGYAVVVARNGKDGLKRASERKPDVILLDYMMPVMDGRTMLKTLRADPALASIPVVMMSAMPRSSIPTDCKPDAFLRKPFDLLDLLAQLERLTSQTGQSGAD